MEIKPGLRVRNTITGEVGIAASGRVTLYKYNVTLMQVYWNDRPATYVNPNILEVAEDVSA